jgi:hypothetical protein
MNFKSTLPDRIGSRFKALASSMLRFLLNGMEARAGAIGGYRGGDRARGPAR